MAGQVETSGAAEAKAPEAAAIVWRCFFCHEVTERDGQRFDCACSREPASSEPPKARSLAAYATLLEALQAVANQQGRATWSGTDAEYIAALSEHARVAIVKATGAAS